MPGVSLWKRPDGLHHRSLRLLLPGLPDGGPSPGGVSLADLDPDSSSADGGDGGLIGGGVERLVCSRALCQGWRTALQMHLVCEDTRRDEEIEEMEEMEEISDL
ncbi:hypothetical protein NHX12_027208 [Muraenolepis orangiensis]|uniref:Uncharacterized protein n=1 Tax=Muraenolepis orangiensis TaxID=630683 RepID=A0A9Q0IP01_9TELE|nr:hypothetical protein NHX12_027208 [Muraenolepis orangiensis]